MKYKQSVTFIKSFEIEAKNAAEANEKLLDLVSQTEWDADLRHDGFRDFEDEDIDCPKCKGNGEINDQKCDLCNGASTVPFGTVYNP